MQCQAKADEPELANTWPWEDAPSFVSLRCLSTNGCSAMAFGQGMIDCPREFAYNAVDMRLDVFRRNAAVFLEDGPGIWSQLGGEQVMIPRPRDTASTVGRRSIEHLRHLQSSTRTGPAGHRLSGGGGGISERDMGGSGASIVLCWIIRHSLRPSPYRPDQRSKTGSLITRMDN